MDYDGLWWIMMDYDGFLWWIMMDYDGLPYPLNQLRQGQIPNPNSPNLAPRVLNP